MRRGTTPTLTLTVDAEIADWTLYVALRNGCNTIIIDGERLQATQADGSTDIVLTLTQEETLAMHTGDCELQVRAVNAGGTAVATDIARVDVGRIIQDGVLDG